MRRPSAVPLAVLLAVALALAGGCAPWTRAFRCPARGGPAWRELASDHFVLRTDMSGADAATLLGRLERMRAAVSAALPEAPPTPGRIEVIAFRSSAEYEEFAPDGASGYYLRNEGGPPRIVMAGAIGPAQRALLAHELTHHFLAGALRGDAARDEREAAYRRAAALAPGNPAALHNLAQELLGLQAEAYRFVQTVDLAAKLVEQGAQAVKQAVNTPL